MCLGDKGRGPQRGAEVVEGLVGQRPDENRGRPIQEQGKAKRLSRAKRKRGNKEDGNWAEGGEEGRDGWRPGADMKAAEKGHRSRVQQSGSRASGDSGPAPTHRQAAHLPSVTPEAADPLPSQGWAAVGEIGVKTPGLGPSAWLGNSHSH